MPVLENARHEKFCQSIAKGLSGQAAYESAFPARGEAARVSASRLLIKATVEARLAELRSKNEEKCDLTREQLVKMMVDTLKAPPIEAGMDNPLCELKMSKAGPYAAFMDKTRAAERLCKMLGWDSAEKIEHSMSMPNIEFVVPPTFVERRACSRN